jgi:arylsulfatase A-like enzyme
MKSVNWLWTAGLIAAFPGIKAEEKQPAKRMNIIFIMSDDHTRQAISCYGSKYGYTPNIDRLASEGVKFNNCFVSNSISGPSRASILTGKHSHANGFVGNYSVFDGSQQTVHKLLAQAGYTSAVIGKWHLKSTPVGFDHWDILPGQGDYYNPDFINKDGEYVEQGYVTNIITDKCIDWIDKQKQNGKPYILFMHHKAPHRTWMPDLKNLGLYKDVKFEIPDNFFDSYEGRTAAKEQDMNVAHTMRLGYDFKMYHPRLEEKSDNYALKKLNPEEKKAWRDYYNPILERFLAQNPLGDELLKWKLQRYLQDYYETSQSVDQSIGQMIEYLTLSGQIENTLIIYTSDQGSYLGEHGFFDKRFMYEESFSTPLVIRLPKNYFNKTGFAINDLVQNIDHAPTFLEMAGIKIPSDIHGESYLPLLNKHKKVNPRKSLYYHYYEYPAPYGSVKRHYGVRTDRYKLIHFYNDIDEWELYDLKNDPREMMNLINDQKYGSLVVKLKKELNRLIELYKVPDNYNELYQAPVGK